jgi:hypothetical protein
VSERESEEKIVLLSLSAIRPAPFNLTLMQPHEEDMLRERCASNPKASRRSTPYLSEADA